jgi:hypothetical protein
MCEVLTRLYRSKIKCFDFYTRRLTPSVASTQPCYLNAGKNGLDDLTVLKLLNGETGSISCSITYLRKEFL